MIKCIYCIGLYLCLIVPAEAQTISNELISNTGDMYISGSSGSIEGALGLIAASDWISSQGAIYEGFYHPTTQISFSSRKKFTAVKFLTIKTFPNPVITDLNILAEESGIYKAEILDNVNRVILSVEFRQNTKLDMSHLTPGSYFLRVNDKKKHESIVKIIKM